MCVEHIKVFLESNVSLLIPYLLAPFIARTVIAYTVIAYTAVMALPLVPNRQVRFHCPPCARAPTTLHRYNFPGLRAGDKWCLCALRWREAMLAGCAPKVALR